MPKLTDRQLVILSAAAKNGGAVLPVPKSLKLNKAVATSVLNSLAKRGLIAERPAGHGAEVWRQAKDGHRMTLVITETGLAAIGIEPEGSSAQSAAATKPRPKTRGGCTTRKSTVSKPTGKTPPARRQPSAAKPKGKAAAAGRSGPSRPC